MILGYLDADHPIVRNNFISIYKISSHPKAAVFPERIPDIILFEYDERDFFDAFLDQSLDARIDQSLTYPFISVPGEHCRVIYIASASIMTAEDGTDHHPIPIFRQEACRRISAKKARDSFFRIVQIIEAHPGSMLPEIEYRFPIRHFHFSDMYWIEWHISSLF